MARKPKKTHLFTVEVTAPAFLSRREVARELRTLVNEQHQYLSGKHVADKFGSLKWQGLQTGDLRLRTR